MTPAETSYMGLAHDIRNIASGGISVDDNRWSIRQIIFWIKTYYAEIIEEEIEKKSRGILNYKIDNTIVNDLGCIPLEKADKADCGCYKIGCTVLRTQPLPKIYSFFGKPMITYVGGIDKQSSYVMSTPQNVSAATANRFGASNIYWYFQNDRVYIVVPKSMADIIVSCINIQAITQDTTATMPQCGSKAGATKEVCFDYWSESGIPLKYLNRIRQSILTREMSAMAQSPTDKINNGTH